jgi:hypothetical protein
LTGQNTSHDSRSVSFAFDLILLILKNPVNPVYYVFRGHLPWQALLRFAE